MMTMRNQSHGAISSALQDIGPGGFPWILSLRIMIVSLDTPHHNDCCEKGSKMTVIAPAGEVTTQLRKQIQGDTLRFKIQMGKNQHCISMCADWDSGCLARRKSRQVDGKFLVVVWSKVVAIKKFTLSQLGDFADFDQNQSPSSMVAGATSQMGVVRQHHKIRMACVTMPQRRRKIECNHTR